MKVTRFESVEEIYRDFAEKMRTLLPNPWAAEELERAERHLEWLEWLNERQTS